MRSLTLSLLFVLLFLSSCATTNSKQKENQIPPDPLQSYNRVVFKFNRKVDAYLYRPAAVAYDAVIPDIVENGVSNFFNNLSQIPTVFNDVMQLDGYYMFNDTWRFAINSTFGIGGLFDVAKHIGLQPHYQDFGITLGRWGYQPSSYLMIPFLGPSTIRETTGTLVDTVTSVWFYIDPMKITYSLYGLKLINSRAQNLQLNQLIEQAFDPYIFVRNGYLQMREQLIESDDQPGDSYINPIATSGHTKQSHNKEDGDGPNSDLDERQDAIVIGG